jgi:hypothetical protein
MSQLTTHCSYLHNLLAMPRFGYWKSKFKDFPGNNESQVFDNPYSQQSVTCNAHIWISCGIVNHNSLILQPYNCQITARSAVWYIAKCSASSVFKLKLKHFPKIQLVFYFSLDQISFVVLMSENHQSPRVPRRPYPSPTVPHHSQSLALPNSNLDALDAELILTRSPHQLNSPAPPQYLPRLVHTGFHFF